MENRKLDHKNNARDILKDNWEPLLLTKWELKGYIAGILWKKDADYFPWIKIWKNKVIFPWEKHPYHLILNYVSNNSWFYVYCM